MRWILLLAARHPWLALGAVTMALAIGGFAFAASGLIPLKASSGHWAITEWMLQFGKRRSVSTHAMRLSAPRLDDPALVLRGAGHYELGCRPCHGAVAGERPRVALAMLPVPPRLPSSVPEWSPEELFYIVKHGLKFTGMPAWPARDRDDEVWAMVAFLRLLPAMGAEEYLRLSRGEPDVQLELDPAGEPTPEVIADSCARCHGVVGLGRGEGAFPRLAGQKPEYLVRSLQAYAEGRRHSGIMGAVAVGLTPATMDAAARFYAGLAPRPRGSAGTRTSDGGDASRGRRIAGEGIPDRDVPACVECHGPAATEKHPVYPELAGQDARYLALQLQLLQERRRGGTEFLHLMLAFVDRLTDADIRDVSAFYGDLNPRGTPSS
jgi:cytochrome c553